MMALYPSLEDMVADQHQTMHHQRDYEERANPSFVEPSAPFYESRLPNAPVYESIGNTGKPTSFSYPVLPPYFSVVGGSNREINDMQFAENRPSSLMQTSGLSSCVNFMGSSTMIAPITNQSPGWMKANVSHGIRQVSLTKDSKGKYGIRLRAVNKGVFVQFVASGSTAAAVGIRFGDQVLKINETEVVGMTSDKAMELLNKTRFPGELVITLRDRPFERAIVLHKDSHGQLGFTFKENLITAIMKNSSSSHNGLLINHRILEIDGQNVIGYKTKEIRAFLDEAPETVTLTIMPSEMYDEMIKKMGWSLMKKQDHSIPDI